MRMPTHGRTSFSSSPTHRTENAFSESISSAQGKQGSRRFRTAAVPKRHTSRIPVRKSITYPLRPAFHVSGTKKEADRTYVLSASLQKRWWTRQASNLRQSGYEPGALPTELRVQQRKICAYSSRLAREKTGDSKEMFSFDAKYRSDCSRISTSAAVSVLPCAPR